MGLIIRLFDIVSKNDFKLYVKIGGKMNCDSLSDDEFTLYTTDNQDGVYESSLTRNYRLEPILIKGLKFNNIFLKNVFIKLVDVKTDLFKIEKIKIHGIGFYADCFPDNVCDFEYDTIPLITPTPTPTPTPTLTNITNCNLQYNIEEILNPIVNCNLEYIIEEI